MRKGKRGDNGSERARWDESESEEEREIKGDRKGERKSRKKR